MFYNIFQKLKGDSRQARRRKAGQAMLELAIFGSLILFLLATLISYGMRFDAQQQANMEVFRKAQWKARQKDNTGHPYGSASYTILKEKHIPDPSNPFGVGSVSPIVASASVTRDNRMDAVADDYDGLPKMRMIFQSNVNGVLTKKEVELAVAGRRFSKLFVPDTQDDLERLQIRHGITYGSIENWPEQGPNGDYQEWDDWGAPGNWWGQYICILDSVEGEVVDYDSAIRQARLLVDRGYFINECNKQDPKFDCPSIWDNTNVHWVLPWYVAGAQIRPNGAWYFPEIEELFIYPNSAPNSTRNVAAMGLQANNVSEVNNVLTLTKNEDDEEIETTDNLAWSTVTSRVIYYNKHLDKVSTDYDHSGTPLPGPRIKKEEMPITTERSDNRGFIWQTEWE